MKVFWSWQSDTPGKIGRHFVRDALTAAIKELKETLEIEEPDQRETLADLHLDQDRKGVPGSPDLARVILEKIEKSSVFVADVTPVGRISAPHEGKQEKKTINPNVAIELGYALHALGDRALLMVLNEHYGGRTDLPFDLQSKAGPIIFGLSPDADKNAIDAATKRLKSELRDALKLQIDNHVENIRQQTPFPAAESKDGPARFRQPNEPLGIRSNGVPFGLDAEDPIFLAKGPALWLRLMPATNPGRTWPPHVLKENALRSSNFALMPFYVFESSHGLRAEDGYGIFTQSYAEPHEAISIAFAFETGEIWSIDTLFLSNGKKIIPFPEPYYNKSLQNYTRFLTSLGIDPPYRWICGMTGVNGYCLEVPVRSGHIRPGPGPQCLSSDIIAEGRYDGAQTPTRALVSFFNKIFEKCGLPRPDHLPTS